jgi:NAD(P)-dependent dehydrogenase (short-subunit alcohol dehydrogenase family)
MDLKLQNKTAFISGSTAGIGFAIAERLAREGARVIINGRTQKRVAFAIQSLHKNVPHAKIEGIPGDLAHKKGCGALVRQLRDVDILVNNLGIFEPKSFEEIPDEDWLRFFEVNVMSGVRLSRAYLPGMKKRNWGRIVFISSESAVQIPAEMIHYGMTKTAQIAIARGLAESCAGTGITVNSVLAGPTASEGVTDFIAKLADEKSQTPAEFEKDFFKHLRPTSLVKRFLKPDEIASVVAFACSPEASAINGATLRAEGGVIKSAF